MGCSRDASMNKPLPDFGPEADAAVKATCALFPPVFLLRKYPGEFRVSESASYVSGGVVMVYVQRRFSGTHRGNADEGWRDFAKGTVEELKGQIVSLP